MINLYQTDCMEFMSSKPDKFYRLAIVDPPYGINIEQRVFKDYKKWDSERPSKEYFNELFRVSENQIIWGGNYFIDYLYPTKCFLIWDKKITDAHLLSMSEFAWTSFNSVAKTFYQPPCGERGFYKIGEKRIHPTQKSTDLYKWLLSNYAKPGDNILDTHGGSMSIAIACHDLGFDLDLCELDPDYFAAGKARYEKHAAQGFLIQPSKTNKPETGILF